VRPAAHIHPLALAVEADGLAVRQVADQFDLEALALALEQGDGILARKRLAWTKALTPR
jgi:hypothetical protein